MNRLVDMHVHSAFSPDSKQSIESYFKAETVHRVLVTDHLDFWNETTHEDVSPDYDSLKSTLEIMSKKYNKDYYLGIEVGYHPSVHNKTCDYLKGKNYDVLILSFHQDGSEDYLYTKKGYQVNAVDYLENIIEGLSTVDNVTTLGHFDYPFRNNQVPDKFWQLPQINQVLELLIEKNIALEVNTRSIYEYRNLEFYKILLSKYHALGGRLVALGSDAHSLKYYQYHFDDALALLRQIAEFEIINTNY